MSSRAVVVRVDEPPIPILLLVDVEPDRFFLAPDDRATWSGFERGMMILADLRRMLAERTGRRARFTWLVRADEQIAKVYGTARWALEYYRERFDELSELEDEIGLHVHAYHWEEARNRWIEDYGSQPWVDHCVRLGVGAFEEMRGHPPRAFSMGMDWTSQATIRLTTALKVRYEFSPVPGTRPQPMRFNLGAYTGVAPNCTNLPSHPYHPAPDDFTSPCAPATSDIWIFPQSSRIAPPDLSWKRRAYNRLRRHTEPPCARKFFLTDDAAGLRPAIDTLLRTMDAPYLTFAIRTDEFRKHRSVAAVARNLEHVLTHPAAARLVFSTPAEALQLLCDGRNAGAVD